MKIYTQFKRRPKMQPNMRLNTRFKWFSSFMGIFLAIPLLRATEPPPISGVWRYSELIYRGQVMPLPDPNLNLTWTFFDNGTERLHWNRKGENSFCERFAHYELKEGKIFETVFALNPRNGHECAKDPDMQLGRVTSNKIEIQNQQILFHMQMGEEEVIYVLKKLQ